MAARAFYTPRDKLQRLVDYAVRARRYWWIVAGFVIMGGALSVAFAMTRPKTYESSAVLFYQERIQTSLIQGRDAAQMNRNIGDRYRELLLARTQLSKIIEDPTLDVYQDTAKTEGMEAAVEELRGAISFQVRGANTFKIAFKDGDRHKAQAVAQRLTELLIEKERDMRMEQAKATVDFAKDQLDAANLELRGRESARFQFLSQHPEFAEDDSSGGEGAAIRKKDKEPTATAGAPATGGSRRLSALTRQRDRIKARLAAGDSPAPVPQPRTHVPTAEENAAQAKVDRAEDEVRGAARNVEELRNNGLTDNHPDMRKAKDNLAGAQSRLKKAEAELAGAQARSGDDDVIMPPSSPMDRAALEKELKEVESEIADERNRMSSGTAPKPTPVPEKTDNIADVVIGLESDWARLGREVAEQEERVQTLNDAFFRAQLDAQTRTAEQGTALQVVDEAYLPLRPIGKGKKLLVLAGLVVFSGLGLALAVGLAIIDDRVYRRVDIEQLDLAPVLAVIPRGGKPRKPKPT